MDLLTLSILYKLIDINDTNIIIDIFQIKNINRGVVFHCHNDTEFLKLQKLYNNHQILVTGQKIGTNIRKLTFPSSKTGIIVDTACNNWDAICSLDSMLKRPFTWIVKTNDLTSAVDKLSHYPIEIDSDFLILSRKNEVSHLYEFFNTGFITRGSFIVRNIGYYDTKLHITREIGRRTNLTGVVLKCPLVIIDAITNETYMHFLERIEGPHGDPIHRFKFYRVLRYLGQMYNFSYDFQRTSSWGYLRNGTFDGMVGAFQRQQADVGGSGLFFRNDRAKYVGYSVEIWKSRSCFIFRHPKHLGGFYTIYTRPLSDTVWFCLMILLLAAGVLTCFILHIKSHGGHADHSPSLLLIFITSAIGQQGIQISSHSTSLKIVIFSTLILTLTLYQYYNAAVVSTLLRERPRNIKSLEDLLHSKLQVGIEDTLYDKDYLKRTTDPVALELYHKKIVTRAKSNIFKAERGMAMVKRGGFAFHLDSVTGYRIMRQTFTEREICDVFEIQLYPPQHVGVVLKKGSPYREHFTVGVRKMYEAGLMNRLRTLWDEPKPRCVRTPDSSVFSVNIQEFSIALVILGLGVVVSLILLLGEIVIFKISTKRIPFRH